MTTLQSCLGGGGQRHPRLLTPSQQWPRMTVTHGRCFSCGTVIDVRPPLSTQKRKSGLEDRKGTGSLSLAETHLLTDVLGPRGRK